MDRKMRAVEENQTTIGKRARTNILFLLVYEARKLPRARSFSATPPS
jgi:hypothetical protein